MLFDLDRSRQDLDRYRDRLFDVKGAEQTSVMKEREDFNILTDDIYCISRARLSIRVNKALFREFADSGIEVGAWKKVRFLPKGFSNPEEVRILIGDRCKKRRGEDGEYGYDLG
jgi:hypothetical protein